MSGFWLPVGSGGGGDLTLIQELDLSLVTSFTGIPTTYKDLLLLILGRVTAAVAGSGLSLRLNGDASTNYYGQRIQTFGTTVQGQTQVSTTSMTIGAVTGASSQVGAPGMVNLSLLGYTSPFHKGILWNQFEPQAYASGSMVFRQGGGMWANTSVVSSLDIIVGNPPWTSDSRARLYGLG